MQCPSFEGSMSESDQKKGLPHPIYDNDKTKNLIELPEFKNIIVKNNYVDLLLERKSERVFTNESITQEELAFMLWSANGVHSTRGNGISTFRPVPSGGARHPFEIYFIVQNVEGLESGIYHYLPMHNIGEMKVTIERIGDLPEQTPDTINALVVGQKWAVKAPVLLFISCIPYRAEWRYNDAAHRVMLIDLGHLGQNMMLSATSLGLGSCCLAAYHQVKCDALFGFNGIDEYIVYVLPFGNVKK